MHGHTKNYSNGIFKCVKCAKDHKSSDCPEGKKINKPICANCGGEHPANYKGCEIWKEIQKKLFPSILHRNIVKEIYAQTTSIEINLERQQILMTLCYISSNHILTEEELKEILPKENHYLIGGDFNANITYGDHE